MKRNGLAAVLVLALIVLAGFLARPVWRVKAHQGCSNRTLMGNYGWDDWGLEPETAGAPFWAQSGLAHFDGAGNFTGTYGYFILSGVLSGPGSVTGTYAVNQDCTVTINYTYESVDYSDHGVVVGPGGSEVMAVESSNKSDTTGKLTLKRVSDPE